ncbi:hypothetical protein F5880DRAFT_1729584 [Lentinula raphanica]|nr:hypothetical protein F5880DRAFT_1729584 [Lentinula raphanica]
MALRLPSPISPILLSSHSPFSLPLIKATSFSLHSPVRSAQLSSLPFVFVPARLRWDSWTPEGAEEGPMTWSYRSIKHVDICDLRGKGLGKKEAHTRDLEREETASFDIQDENKCIHAEEDKEELLLSGARAYIPFKATDTSPILVNALYPVFLTPRLSDSDVPRSTTALASRRFCLKLESNSAVQHIEDDGKEEEERAGDWGRIIESRKTQKRRIEKDTKRVERRLSQLRILTHAFPVHSLTPLPNFQKPDGSGPSPLPSSPLRPFVPFPFLRSHQAKLGGGDIDLVYIHLRGSLGVSPPSRPPQSIPPEAVLKNVVAIGGAGAGESVSGGGFGQ